jgi:peptidoglycan/LPS O-acetylase OafA/YrhL
VRSSFSLPRFYGRPLPRFFIEPKFDEMYGIHRSTVGLALIGPIAVSCVAFCVMLPTLPIRPAIATGIGGLTYPLYLLHQHIGYATFARFVDRDRWIVAAVLVATLLLAPWLIAAFFEPPARPPADLLGISTAAPQQ